MNIGIIYALIAATAFGFWTFFHKLATPYINSLFGAIVVSLTAVVVGIVFLIPNIKSTTLFTDLRGIIFLVLAGISAIIIDYFALKAYGANLPISVIGPIIMGGSIGIAVILGLLMGETVSFLKLIGITLIIVGTIILSSIT